MKKTSLILSSSFAFLLFCCPSFVVAQEIVIDFDGSMGGEDMNPGAINGQSDSNGEWFTRAADDVYHVIEDPNDPNNKLLSVGQEPPGTGTETYWFMYVINGDDQGEFRGDLYFQFDWFFPDDPAPLDNGMTLAGYYTDPLSNQWNDNQVLIRNEEQDRGFDVRSAGTYTSDVEIFPVSEVWYRFNAEISVPDQNYNVWVTDMSTGEKTQIAENYDFRGNVQLASDEGLAVIAFWSSNPDDGSRPGRVFIDNIFYSTEPFTTDVQEWSVY